MKRYKKLTETKKNRLISETANKILNAMSYNTRIGYYPINEARESTKNANRLIKHLYKSVQDLTSHIYRDNDWHNVDNVFNRIEDIVGDMGEVFVWCEHGGYVKDSNGTPIYKEWKLRIELNDGGIIGGSVKAHTAGSMQDPFDAYDITCTFYRETEF